VENDAGDAGSEVGGGGERKGEEKEAYECEDGEVGCGVFYVGCRDSLFGFFLFSLLRLVLVILECF